MSNLGRPFALVCLLTLLPGLSSSPVFAQYPVATTQNSVLTLPAGKLINDLGNQAIAVLAEKNISEEERNAKFRQMLREAFDLATIGRFVIGRNWLAATPQQQQEYMSLFEALVVKTYSDRFALYTGEGFRVRSVQPEGERDFIVISEITHPDGSAPTTVDWRLRQKGGKLGIIDVVVEGVSMSVTQRQEYSAVIDRNGGNIEGLLNVMRQRLKGPVSTKQTMKN